MRPGGSRRRTRAKGMSEADWLACDSPEPMLRHLGGEEFRTTKYVDRSGNVCEMRLLGCPQLKASKRKFRLFGSACCGQIAHLLPHECYRRCLEFGLQYADGEV